MNANKCSHDCNRAHVASHKAAYEAGNIWLPDVDAMPLSRSETVLAYASMAMGCAICFSVIVFGVDAFFRWL